MKSPSLSLEALQIHALSILTLSGYSEDRPAGEAITRVGFRTDRHAEDPHRMRVLLDLKIDRQSQGDNVPYRIIARAIGYFALELEIPAEVHASIVANALTIMYGALRGMVLQTTGAYPYGPVILPTVLMYDVAINAAAAGAIEDDDSEIAQSVNIVGKSGAAKGAKHARRTPSKQPVRKKR